MCGNFVEIHQAAAAARKIEIALENPEFTRL
jgi:hypothetical protein